MRQRVEKRIIWLAVFLIAIVATNTIAQSNTDTSDLSVQEMEDYLSGIAVFSRFDADSLEALFDAGQTLGNRANVFTTVGDSNTSNGDFLRPLGLTQNDCRFGPYAPLRRTIEYFSAAPRTGYRNSFTNDSVAAEIGFGTPMVLDPFWADQSQCQRNETPLSCEYRVTRPSVAIIMLGQVDNNQAQLPVEDYAANMETIIQTTISQGIIPVVTTIVFQPDREEYERSLRYNLALVRLSEQYDIPLLNLWAAVQMLPNTGIGPDRSHLSARVGSFCAFDGPEQELGGTLRNLLTLQALDQLRTNILTAP